MACWCEPGGGSYAGALAHEPAAARTGKKPRVDVTKSSCGRFGDRPSKAMTKI